MKNHRKAGGSVFANCLPLCSISPSSVVLHRTLLDDVGCFDESLPACEDYDLWIRITARHPVLFLGEPLVVKYGGHQDQLSQKHWGMDRFRIYALDKILRGDRLTAEQSDLVLKMLQARCRIFLQGARKRGRDDEHTLRVENVLNHWQFDNRKDSSPRREGGA